MHKEIIKISQSTRQWILSIVLLINTIFHLIMYYYKSIGAIPNKSFRKDDFIALTIILILISIVVVVVLFFTETKIIITKDILMIRQKGMKEISYTKSMIKSFRKISKKEFVDMRKEINSAKFANKNTKKGYKRVFITGFPNFEISLNNEKKIFIQTKKKSSFEYSMNKLLNLKYV